MDQVKKVFQGISFYFQSGIVQKQFYQLNQFSHPIDQDYLSEGSSHQLKFVKLPNSLYISCIAYRGGLILFTISPLEKAGLEFFSPSF